MEASKPWLDFVVRIASEHLLTMHMGKLNMAPDTGKFRMGTVSGATSVVAVTLGSSQSPACRLYWIDREVRAPSRGVVTLRCYGHGPEW